MASLAGSAVEPITSKNGFREKSITYNLYVSTRLIKKHCLSGEPHDIKFPFVEYQFITIDIS